MRKGRSERLRERFGPEYDRTVTQLEDRSRAEAELKAREKRVDRLDIRSLTEAERGRFAESWRSVQAQFVDDPARAIAEADRLVGEVMRGRGYPVGEFEERAADISVGHPHVVENYRAAHGIAVRSGRREASTEDLRQAMVHYRALFEELLEARATDRREVQR